MLVHRDRQTRQSPFRRWLPVALSTLALSLTGIASLQAEEVAVPVGQQAMGVEKPGMGLTMEMVEARFGAPDRRGAAIGNPPITRWDYPTFSVYFEYQTVIHAVAHKAPAAN